MAQDSSIQASVRPATPDDFARVLATENQVQTAPWNSGHFEAELMKPYSRFWVLSDDETDQEILGYIVFWVLLGDAQILNVATALEYRGMGYGQRLVREAVKEAIRAGAKKIVLDVRKSNLPAIHLYQKVGFLTARVQKGAYSDGEDALSMEMTLTGEDPAKILGF